MFISTSVCLIRNWIAVCLYTNTRTSGTFSTSVPAQLMFLFFRDGKKGVLFYIYICFLNFLPSACFASRPGEEKKSRASIWLVPIKIDLSSMAAAQQRQFLICLLSGSCLSHSHGFFLVPKEEGGRGEKEGAFWQDQIWQTSSPSQRESALFVII